MNKKIFFSCICLMLSCWCNAQSANTTEKYSHINIENYTPEEKNLIKYKLDSFYTKRVEKGFSGQVLIGYKGTVLYERYFGYADKETERLIDANSPSQLASTSKPITAITIAQLKEKGLLNFDDTVTKFIPLFPYPTITIRNLLTHRTGLPEYFGMAMSKILPPQDSLMSNDSLISLLIEKHPKLRREPDTKFQYTNTNYAILSYLVQLISGEKFSTYVQKNIFEPLGMYNSYVFDNAAIHSPNYCKNYKGRWTVQKDMRLDGITGDKSVYSTAQDLYKLDQALYNNFLQPQTLKEMYTPHSFERGGYQNYGLGWRMFNYPNQKVIFHNGYWHGNNNCFYRFTTDNFTIIILGNKLNNYIYAHPQVIYNIVMNSHVELTEIEE
jgi:CubicO group peptidase (beta-lactamase class C family)